MAVTLACVVGLLVLATGPSAPLVPPAESGVANVAAGATADTLRETVTAGEDLILTLPPSTDAAYSVLRAPALSWLVDRSFLWRTRPSDVGSHTVTFAAAPDSRPADTLVVRIDVAAP